MLRIVGGSETTTKMPTDPIGAEVAYPIVVHVVHQHMQVHHYMMMN